jgi:hypothetical protein
LNINAKKKNKAEEKAKMLEEQKIDLHFADIVHRQKMKLKMKKIN